jgi:two-component system sensor histidine kinase/response regulator
MDMNDSIPKILAVDDNPRNIQVIGSILREANYRIGFAVNGRQALDILNESNDYDLVLLDVSMPVMNGYEACRMMRADERLKEIPVIFLTALTDTENVVAGFKFGAQDYVTKPFNAEELLSRVKTHIELKRSKDMLKKLNEHLEELVQERTEQLARANEQLKAANEELMKLDEAKAEFLRIISHEINTPLNGILGFTTLLKEELEATEMGALLDDLDISAKRLERFARVSLLVTELNTDRAQVTRNELHMRALVEKALQSLNETIDGKHVNVRIEQEGDPCVYAGESLMDISMESILDNAVRYSPVSEEVLVQMTSSGEGASFSVTDHGPGFSPKAFHKMFSLFAPGERHVNQNTGLSLALVKLIMDAHGGTIDVRNNEGGGATVRLFFPVHAS